jgi:hypothetical protein
MVTQGAVAVEFSQAELTVLARMAGRTYFPGAPQGELDDAGWAAVGRGLMARGVLHGRLRRTVDDDVAALLDVVMGGDWSLWLQLQYNPGLGENSAEVLWIKGDDVVRQTKNDQDVHRLERVQPAAVDEIVSRALDLPTAQDSQAGEPFTMTQLEYSSACSLTRDEGAAAGGARYPAAAEYLQARDDARRATWVQSQRGYGIEVSDCEQLTLIDVPDALWLARPESRGELPEDGSGRLVVQRVTMDEARERVTALAGGAG